MYVGAALSVMVTNSHFGVTSAEVQAWKSGELEKNFLKARSPYMVAFFVSTAIATPSLAILTWLVYTHAVNVLNGTTTRQLLRETSGLIMSTGSNDTAKGYITSEYS